MAILMDICVIIAFLIAVIVGKVTKKFNIPVHLIVSFSGRCALYTEFIKFSLGGLHG